jgi:predicted RNase H-like HicB family nuclease
MAPATQFRVLGYEEDGKFVAHILEMDLRGYGATVEEAFREVEAMGDAHIEFATERENLDLIFRPAEKKYFEMWEQVQRELFFAEVRMAQMKEQLRSRSHVDVPGWARWFSPLEHLSKHGITA